MLLKRHTQSVKNAPFNFEKKIIQGAYWVFTKKIFPGFSRDTLKKHEFCTNEIKQKSEHFAKQLRCYNQSNWTYKFNKSFKVKKAFYFLSKILSRSFFLSYFFSASSSSSTSFFFSPAAFCKKFLWATRTCMLLLHQWRIQLFKEASQKFGKICL